MYGARPIRTWVQNNVMTVISEMLIKKEATKGSTISIDASDDKKRLKYDVVKKEVVDPPDEVPSASTMGMIQQWRAPWYGCHKFRSFSECILV
jgi:hypothetical protein